MMLDVCVMNLFLWRWEISGRPQCLRASETHEVYSRNYSRT